MSEAGAAEHSEVVDDVKKNTKRKNREVDDIEEVEHDVSMYAYDRYVDGFSEGAAFYASGNVASEALRHYCADLWTEEYAAKAARTGEQRM